MACMNEAAKMFSGINSPSAADLECTFGLMLGCKNGFKAVEDGEKYELHKCAFYLLQQMNIEHPVGHLILSALDAHHKQFRCGTRTLLVLTLWLFDAATDLIAQGMSIDDVIDGYYEGFRVCIEHLEHLKLICVPEKSEKVSVEDNELAPAVDAEDEFEDISWYFENTLEIKPPVSKTNPHQEFAFDGILHDFVTKKCEVTDSQYSSLKSSSADFDEFDECFVTDSALHLEKKAHNSLSEEGLPMNDLEQKIRRILDSKPCDNAHTRMLNRSRHFRTFATAHEEHTTSQLAAPLSKRVSDFPESAKVMENIVSHKSNTAATDGYSESHKDIALVSNEVEPTVLHSKSNSSIQEKYEFSCDLFLQMFLSQKFHETIHLEEMSCTKDDFYCKFVRGICHDEDNIVRLVTDLFRMQNDISSDKIRFQKDLVHYCQTSQLSPKWSCVVQGVVVKTTQEQFDLLETQSGKIHKILLLNSDLTPTFKHKGHKETLKGHQFSKEVLRESHLQKWIDRCLRIFEVNGVTAVFIRGSVIPDLQLQCYAKGIVIIASVPVKVLQTLAEATSSDLLVYLEDIEMSNASVTLKISLWHPDWMDFNREDQFVILRTKDINFQTVILCSWNGDLANILEDAMHHAVYRLHYIMNDGYCLPGSSVTELVCSEHLLCMTDGSNNCQDVILRSLASVFQRSFHAIHANNGFSNVHCLDDLFKLSKMEECIYLDDYPSKVAVWRGSCHLLKQILCLDLEIVSGWQRDPCL